MNTKALELTVSFKANLRDTAFYESNILLLALRDEEGKWAIENFGIVAEQIFSIDNFDDFALRVLE